MSCFSFSGFFSLDACLYNASSRFSQSLDMTSTALPSVPAGAYQASTPRERAGRGLFGFLEQDAARRTGPESAQFRNERKSIATVCQELMPTPSAREERYFLNLAC